MVLCPVVMGDSEMKNPKRNVKRYTAPGVSIEVTFESVPHGYIKDLPIKGAISAKAMKNAVVEVVSERSEPHKAGRYSKYYVPRKHIKRGEQIRISGAKPTRHHLSRQPA